MRRGSRRFDVANARRALVDLISRDKGLVSFRLNSGEEALIALYFDQRADFERVSDKPEWQPRATRRPPTGRFQDAPATREEHQLQTKSPGQC